MWSRSGSTGTARSTITGELPTIARSRMPRGSRRVARSTTAETSGAPTRVVRMPSLASASCGPLKASVAISSETVKPMPAIAAPPSTDPQPTGGTIRPRVTRPTIAVAPEIPSGLPSR